MKFPLTFLLLILITLGCKDSVNSQESGAGDGGIENPDRSKTPLFKNSIVSTDIDFIKATDPDTFLNLSYIRQEAKEMPGNGSDDLIDQNTYVFRVSFKDDTSMEIWAHSSFGSRSAAEEYANKLTPRLGKLPVLMREKINHVIINKGDSTAFAEDAGGFFVLYSDNMDTRISNNDLEETVFHESVHVAFDIAYANSEAWKLAQDNDGVFITEYAESRPNKEDLAESAIFAYTMITYPGRLDQDIEAWVRTNIPNRLKFFQTVFE